MSSSIIDSTDPATAAPSPAGAAPTDHSVHRAWLIAVAIVAAATLCLTLVWQATAGASPASAPTPSAQAVSTTSAVPALSHGAGLLATAWQLAPTSQRRAACSRFAADPASAWAAYSRAGDAAMIATQAEFAAFLEVNC